ncbi:hypothetical protein BT69DRAFT_904000 [Atractiella rhizophila]|nr:hypothetical protein BT69DRAFT_904000 [Atractiella rhizophila]
MTPLSTSRHCLEAYSLRSPAGEPHPVVLAKPVLAIKGGALRSDAFPKARFESLFASSPPNHSVLALEDAVALEGISSDAVVRETGNLLANFVAHGSEPSEAAKAEALDGVKLFLSRKRSKIFWVYFIRQDDSFSIAGYALTGRESPNCIAFRNVYVDPQFRKQGIAEKMVLTISKYNLEEKGKKEINLFCEIENGTAMRLYERCGFEWIQHEAVDGEDGTFVVQQGWEGVKRAPW